MYSQDSTQNTIRCCKCDERINLLYAHLIDLVLIMNTNQYGAMIG